MAEQTNTNRGGGSGITGISFIVGGLLVAVLVIAFFAFGGSIGSDDATDTNVRIETPATGGGTGGGQTGQGGGQGQSGGQSGGTTQGQ